MALPKGMTRTVRAAWPRINATVSHVLELDGALDDVSPDRDMFGCGYWGCAYPTADPMWAVKISADPLEGPIAKAILDRQHLREHSGIAYIFDIWRLKEKVRWGRSGWRDVWVILREAITPAPLDVWGRKPGTAEAADLLWDLKKVGEKFNVAADALDEKGPGYGREDRLNFADRQWWGLILTAQNTYLTHKIGDFMEEFREEFAAVLADVHGGNVGTRDHDLPGLEDHIRSGAWVAFDLGHSDVDTGAEVPLMENPGRIKVL
jgi:hypothetical protein